MKKDHGLAVDAEDLVPQDLDSIDSLLGLLSRTPTMV